MRRWLVAALALLVAAGAILLLLGSPEPVSETPTDHTEIDSQSRAKLREVIREERGD